MPKILIVDDDEGMLQVLNDMLSSAGHEVIEADSSDAAKQAYRENEVDLVVTDFFMPSEGGLEVIRDIRRRDPGAKIILISAADIRDGVDLAAFAQQYGAQRVMNKPINSSDVLDAIDQMLQVE